MPIRLLVQLVEEFVLKSLYLYLVERSSFVTLAVFVLDIILSKIQTCSKINSLQKFLIVLVILLLSIFLQIFEINNILSIFLFSILMKFISWSFSFISWAFSFWSNSYQGHFLVSQIFILLNFSYFKLWAEITKIPQNYIDILL